MIVRSAGDEDVPAVLELWSLARSPHALTPDRAQDIERLVREMPARCSSPRTASASSAR